jgi:hypothetical protein
MPEIPVEASWTELRKTSDVAVYRDSVTQDIIKISRCDNGDLMLDALMEMFIQFNVSRLGPVAPPIVVIGRQPYSGDKSLGLTFRMKNAGETVDAVIRRERRALTPEHLENLIVNVRKLLERSCKRQLLHGDLHCGNVMLDSSGPSVLVTIIDYGRSKYKQYRAGRYSNHIFAEIDLLMFMTSLLSICSGCRDADPLCKPAMDACIGYVEGELTRVHRSALAFLKINGVYRKSMAYNLKGILTNSFKSLRHPKDHPFAKSITDYLFGMIGEYGTVNYSEFPKVVITEDGKYVFEDSVVAPSAAPHRKQRGGFSRNEEAFPKPTAPRLHGDLAIALLQEEHDATTDPLDQQLIKNEIATLEETYTDVPLLSKEITANTRRTRAKTRAKTRARKTRKTQTQRR